MSPLRWKEKADEARTDVLALICIVGVALAAGMAALGLSSILIEVLHG